MCILAERPARPDTRQHQLQRPCHSKTGIQVTRPILFPTSIASCSSLYTLLGNAPAHSMIATSHDTDSPLSPPQQETTPSPTSPQRATSAAFAQAGMLSALLGACVCLAFAEHQMLIKRLAGKSMLNWRCCVGPSWHVVRPQPATAARDVHQGQ